LTRALWASFVTATILVGIALAIALGVGAPDPGVIERAAAAAWGLVGLGAGSATLSRVTGIAEPRGSVPHQPAEVPTDSRTTRLVALERSLRFGATTSGDFYGQVRPRLARLAASFLSLRNVSITDKESVETLLGASAYELVDPRTKPPTDRFSPGVPVEQVSELIGRLEALEDER
jgi:hypothetical protein